MAVATQERIDQIQNAVNLQLAGAAISQGGMMSVKQLFSNIQRFSDIELTYADFIACMESSRDQFDVREGQIGVDVNYMSLKKG